MIKIQNDFGENCLLKKCFSVIFVILLISCLSISLFACSNAINDDNTNSSNDNKKDEESTDTNEYVYFGEYPQSLASESAVSQMSTAINENGYYVSSYDNAQYVRLLGNQRESGYKFANGSIIIKDAVYYFKVEPIKWQVLSTDESGNKLLMSKTVLYYGSFLPTQSYINKNANWYNKLSGTPENIFANNWEYSTVRSWLNNDFLNKAFSIDIQPRIKSGNEFNKISYSLSDKVFFLSVAEVTNNNFGFSTENFEDSQRLAVASDYSRAAGVWMSTVNGYYGMSMNYWLRSAGNGSLYAAFVNNYGYVLTNGNDVGSVKGGYRPAIVLCAENNG